jgi:hypothetical protein
MPDRNKLYVYFQTYHGPIVPVNDLFVCRCPVCGKPKFVISFKYLTGKCLNDCFKGFLVDIISTYHGITYPEAKELVESIDSYNEANVDKEDKAKIVLPPYQTLSVLNRAGNTVREYLKSKCLDLNYLDRIGVGISGERVIVPLRCRGILVAYITQDLKNNGGVYLESNGRASEYLFNEEALFLEDRVYIMNNWMDAATLFPGGVSIKGITLGTIQKNNIIKSSVKEICIVPNAGLYLNGLTMAKTLMKYKPVKVLNLEWFEQNGIGKSPSELGRENILDLEKRTPYMDFKFLFHQNKIYGNKRIVI